LYCWSQLDLTVTSLGKVKKFKIQMGNSLGKEFKILIVNGDSMAFENLKFSKCDYISETIFSNMPEELLSHVISFLTPNEIIGTN
jgi:hypothetical protein